MESFSERIAQILKHYKLQPKELAEKCGVQRSAISHLINGRNRPSVSFLSTLSDVYPELDTRWLLHGKGEMFTNVSTLSNESESSSKYTVGDESTKSTSDTAVTGNTQVHKSTPLPTRTQKEQEPNSAKTIERVIVCYSDGTFSTYEH